MFFPSKLIIDMRISIEKYLNFINHLLIILNGFFFLNLTRKHKFQGTSWHVFLVTIGVRMSNERIQIKRLLIFIITL